MMKTAGLLSNQARVSGCEPESSKTRSSLDADENRHDANIGHCTFS